LREKTQTGYPSIDKPWLKYYDKGDWMVMFVSKQKYGTFSVLFIRLWLC
jgi:hypothetical protein